LTVPERDGLAQPLSTNQTILGRFEDVGVKLLEIAMAGCAENASKFAPGLLFHSK
jgi:hypothetical protein